ncbi:MAG: hypothetical protein CM15mP83_7260 [Flavobacteriaceae bacterium]|nr:MAG: hypothetical protein CM15mP83_7260 [Flavobacteriaceae bacterium]
MLPLVDNLAFRCVRNKNYSRLPNEKIKSITVHSTCNRTEIYALQTDASVLVDLLCAHSQGDQALFSKIGYVLTKKVALEHLFRVGTGLDSQILGILKS